MSLDASTAVDVSVPGSLASTMLRLKLSILRNAVVGSRARQTVAAITIAGSLIGSVWTATRLVLRGHSAPTTATEGILLALSSMFGLWVFGPLLVGGVDDSLDPTRLALLPLERRELRQGLLIGAFVGPMPLATTVVLIGAAIGYAPSSPAAILTIVAVAVALVLCVSLSRALSVLLAFSGRSRRGKDLSVLIASLGAAGLFLGTQSLRYLSAADKGRVLHSLRWLPAGQIAVALRELQIGEIATPLSRIGVVAGIVAIGFRVWLSGVDRLLIDPDASRHERATASPDVGAIVARPLRRWGRRPIVVLASKELRYLFRSPQRRSSLIISIVIGTVFALLQSLRYSHSNPSSVFGAAVAALFGVHATNNVLGTDAASLWLEQTAGARLRDQLRARSIAASPNLMIPTILAGLVLAVLSGGWAEFALLVVCSFTFIGVPLGVGAIVSVVAPFNQPDVGNPYSNKRVTTGQSGLVGLLAVVGIVVLILVAAPPASFLTVAWFDGSAVLVAAAIAFSAFWSYLTWRVGVALAMRWVRDREVDLLANIGSRRATAV